MAPRLLPITLVLTCAGFVGCKMKQTHGSRESGQSRLMDESFAAKNKCNPENHERPFIIEWDATDMSSFESLAASDIVFVKYEGCTLKVLDECKNDSIRGEQGAYKPVEWTTGQLESMDVRNESELYAKLPLAQASLGARVQGGESFHMEYYVAGTRFASRDAVYEKDLEGRYGCDDVTHFVYNYNLGAFALGSANEINVEGGGSIYGFGAGGKHSQSSQVDKKGGDLTVCNAESATEVAGCKAPIRLTLRKIRPGASPEAEAMAAPETPESMAAAAIVNTKIEMSDEARAHYDSAVAKLNSGDGKGCIKELTAHDKLDPKHKSTDPSTPFALIRAQCVMLSGKCNAGKVQARKALEKGASAQWGPEQIDKTVDAYVGMYCQGNMSDRDTLLKALMELNKAAYMTTKDVKFCDKYVKDAARLVGKVKPKGYDDHQIKNAHSALYGTAPQCYARAGNCKKAFQVYKKFYPKDAQERMKDLDPKQKEDIYRSSFESLVGRCKGKF